MANEYIKDVLTTIATHSRALFALEKYTKGSQKSLVGVCDDLLSMTGEALGVALASQFIECYESLNPQQRQSFFTTLRDNYCHDAVALGAATAQYQNSPDIQAIRAINAASEPRRRELFRRINLAPGGTAALVSMRRELLGFMKEDPSLKDVDYDLKYLFVSWFNRGFLEMRRIDWNTSAAVLEKIIRYEAVHAISDWDDLRRRIDPPDRYCYAFFHPSLVDDPLIFVEVALTEEKAIAIQPVLAEDRQTLPPHKADTAVFYSISNCQIGLRGISFGSFLIKQVVENLKMELPNLSRFITLSPIPNFVTWLRTQPAKRLLCNSEEAAGALIDQLVNGDWMDDKNKQTQYDKLLRPLAAHYFFEAKSRGKPFDPVARFHLGNGASLEKVNWMADISENGLRQSVGMMVNYRYKINDIEKNHERYAERDEVVATAKVTRLLGSVDVCLSEEI